MSDEIAKSWLERITDWRTARDRFIGFTAAIFRLEASVRTLVETQSAQQNLLEKQNENHRKALAEIEARLELRIAEIRQSHQADIEELRKENTGLRETVRFIQGQQDIIRSLLERDRRN